MIKKIIAEIESVNKEKEVAKKAMIHEMRKYTLRENVERINATLAKMGVDISLKQLFDPSDDPLEVSKHVGTMAILTPILESIEAALAYSKPE